MIQSVSVNVPALLIAPPLPRKDRCSTDAPFEIVRREIKTVTVLDGMWKIRNADTLGRTVTRWAKGPAIVKFLSITNSSLVRLTVLTLGTKLIISPDEALRIAWRKEPGPWSFPFVTVIVAAGVSVALNKSAAITQGRRKRQHLDKYRLTQAAKCCKRRARTIKREYKI
jgi:hypothetical protein